MLEVVDIPPPPNKPASRRQHWLELLGYGALTSFVVAAAFLAGVITQQRTTRQYGEFSLPVLLQARQLIDRNFLGALPDKAEQEHGMIRGLLQAIGDPYTTFTEPTTAELDTDRLSGRFGGIGAEVTQSENGEIVLKPLAGQPAALAGILAGDVLLAVDGETLTSKVTVDEVVARVRGKVGTTVVVSVRTGTAAPRELSIIRVEVELPSVVWRVLEQDASIGLVDIDRFSDRTAAETRTALTELFKAGVSAVIIDLRGNGGGLLQSGVDTAELFLDGGVILYHARRDHAEETLTAAAGGLAAATPLAVLVDGGSASAAEILAGALRDRKRAPLIGQKTFGKGSVQLIFELEDKSSLHVTNARWYTPTRTELDKQGLEPDIAIEPGTGDTDTVLQSAIEFLQAQP
jgi:carboxyl-terminal processing protease